MNWWDAYPGAKVIGQPSDVVDLEHDSRKVGPGVAFIAVPGQQSDGHAYLEEVAAAGAAALVVQADRRGLWQALQGRVPLVVVESARQAMGPLAAAIQGSPAKRLLLVGITGTDGKTTTSHMVSHVLTACGIDCGYLTSVGFDTNRSFALNSSHMTTLEATALQRHLARAVESGRQAMVVEASSEGLAQHRLDACEFDVAVFTNLTRDHLDFHGSMENYLAAKGILFQMLANPTGKSLKRRAVINSDDPASEYLKTVAGADVLTYGEQAQPDLRLSQIEQDGSYLRFQIEYEYVTRAVRAPVVGRFNAFNATAAVGVALSQEIAFAQAVDSLSSFPGVPGRLEIIDCGQPFRVYVDIASTPAALENVLTALKPTTRGRLWAVFGAAGGRDKARRAGMGQVAARLADRAVLTNEDPRYEDAGAIIEEISQALVTAGRQEGRDFVRLPDRREAILYAFEHAAAEDTVLLAGKATETSIIVGDRQMPWDERALARELLTGR